MRSRFAVGALVVLFALAAVPSPPAGAATLGGKGWWWRENPGQASVTEPGSGLPQVTLPEGRPETPKPGDVPEGGLLVERLADGASAIGAVRFNLLDGESNPVLELKALTTSGVPSLLACQTGSAWSDAEGGRWDSKPLVACDASNGGASVAGVAGEGGVWTFNLNTLLISSGEDDPGSVDIAIVPVRDPAAPLQTPFRIVFDTVQGGSLKTTQGSSNFSSSFDSSAALDSAFSGSLESPLTFTPTDSGMSLVDPDLPAADQGLSATAPAVRAQNPPRIAPPAPPDDSQATAAAVFVIFAAVAAAYYGSQQSTPRVKGLIPLRAKKALPAQDVVRVGGLGRFARSRVSAPIRLG